MTVAARFVSWLFAGKIPLPSKTFARCNVFDCRLRAHPLLAVAALAADEVGARHRHCGLREGITGEGSTGDGDGRRRTCPLEQVLGDFSANEYIGGNLPIRAHWCNCRQVETSGNLPRTNEFFVLTFRPPGGASAQRFGSGAQRIIAWLLIMRRGSRVALEPVLGGFLGSISSVHFWRE